MILKGGGFMEATDKSGKVKFTFENELKSAHNGTS